MTKGFRYAILTTIVLLLASCSSTKYVPDGSYLLDEVHIQLVRTGLYTLDKPYIEEIR